MSELQKTQERSRSETLSVLLGAAFLMATSAIGPGFLTQTISFTMNRKRPLLRDPPLHPLPTSWCS